MINIDLYSLISVLNWEHVTYLLSNCKVNKRLYLNVVVKELILEDISWEN